MDILNSREENNKIKLLVAFIHVHVGGAMTSIVNFLNAIDTDKYDVDVIFYEYYGDRCGIKEEINILPQGKIHKSFGLKNILEKTLSPSYVYAKLREIYCKRVEHNTKKAVQIMSARGCRYSRKITKEYDVAVAYEFFWPMNYVMNHINAKKKIIWHHLEYKTSGLDFEIDKKAMNDADALVFVSDDCMKSYCSLHPEHKTKSFFIPNMLSSSYVRAKGDDEIDLPFDSPEKYFKLLSVARIDFEHKGFDRAVRVFEKLKNDGLLYDVRWIIVGDGHDYESLKAMVAEKGLQEYIYTTGLKLNPIPYMKKCDCFLLPSIFEGKPMVVTEGYIMGLVPVVTRYTSADEQIKSGYDGLVFDNNEEALYKGLKELLGNREIISRMKENVINNDYGNEFEIKRFYELVDKLL